MRLHQIGSLYSHAVFSHWFDEQLYAFLEVLRNPNNPTVLCTPWPRRGEGWRPLAPNSPAVNCQEALGRPWCHLKSTHTVPAVHHCPQLPITGQGNAKIRKQGQYGLTYLWIFPAQIQLQGNLSPNWLAGPILYSSTHPGDAQTGQAMLLLPLTVCVDWSHLDMHVGLGQR